VSLLIGSKCHYIVVANVIEQNALCLVILGDALSALNQTLSVTLLVLLLETRSVSSVKRSTYYIR
jgi:hypothetical protein